MGYANKTLMAGFTTVRDLGGENSLALRDGINQGLVPGPRIWAAGKSIATTGGHADPTAAAYDKNLIRHFSILPLPFLLQPGALPSACHIL